MSKSKRKQRKGKVERDYKSLSNPPEDRMVKSPVRAKAKP